MWYEVITNMSSRPNNPEDNTLIIEADDICSVSVFLKNNSGSFKGKVISIREIYNVYPKQK